MDSQPRFRFFLATDAHALDATDPLWRAPLPLAPENGLVPPPQPRRKSITYADYFEAIRSYLSRNHCEALMRGLPAPICSPSARRPFEEIRIYLEKHGAHYHPARIVIPDLQPPRAFVVNVAVAAAGRQILEADVANLKRLNRRYGYDFIPRVYHWGSGSLNKGRPLKMFLGNWLEGYHEFHVGGLGSGRANILLWDPAAGPRPLSCGQTAQLYRRAAMILTAYYNLYSFEHISAWHHAAGDFVAKVDSGSVDVKLITVRAYLPLFRALEADPETVIQALLLFVLKLSLGMRLDRLNGTGEMVWLDDTVCAATLKGFRDGLHLQARRGWIPDDFARHFMSFMKGLPGDDLFELLAGVAERFPREGAGTALIRKNLKRHLDALQTALADRVETA